MLTTHMHESFRAASSQVASSVGDLAGEPARALFSPPVVRGMLIALLGLNLMDAYFTVLFIHQMQVLPEANPLMEFFLSLGLGAVPFVFVKTLMVGGGAIVLWRRPCDLFTQVGAYSLLVLYGSTVLHFHLFSLSHMA